MYICEKCGALIDDEDLQFESPKKTLMDFIFSEDRSYITNSCSCGGVFAMAKKCDCCNDWMVDEGYEICENCVKQRETLENALTIGSEWTEQITINGFLAFVFSDYIDELEDALVKFIRGTNDKLTEKVQEDIKKYCEYDMNYFTKLVEEKWKEEK